MPRKIEYPDMSRSTIGFISREQRNGFIARLRSIKPCSAYSSGPASMEYRSTLQAMTWACDILPGKTGLRIQYAGSWIDLHRIGEVLTPRQLARHIEYAVPFYGD